AIACDRVLTRQPAWPYRAPYSWGQYLPGARSQGRLIGRHRAVIGTAGRKPPATGRASKTPGYGISTHSLAGAVACAGDRRRRRVGVVARQWTSRLFRRRIVLLSRWPPFVLGIC